MKVPYIPKVLLDIILEYDGRIKYRNGKYIDIIDKKDERYDIITPLIRKKTEFVKTICVNRYGFYFEVEFNTLGDVGLCYHLDCNMFEICYYDNRDERWELIATYI